MNKKAIELSINFLVIVIISIVMLSSGILLVKRYFQTAGEIEAQLNEQTIAQIEELLDEGDIVAVPLKQKTIEDGKNGIFGLGVINVNQEQKVFSPSVTLSSAIGRDKLPVADINAENWVLYESDSFVLNYRENKKIPILISIPDGTPAGTYIFNVEVKILDQPSRSYGITKIYVIVP